MFAIFWRQVLGLLLRLGVDRGQGKDGGELSLQEFGRCWMTALSMGSLLSLNAYLLMTKFAWCLIGGMDASISRASVGMVLKAVQMRQSAFL